MTSSPTGERLAASLDLTHAQTLHEHMTALLARGGELMIDASAVERMSTPCTQVLLAAGRAAPEGFKIVNASDPFRSAIADLGLRDEFHPWMV